MSDESSTTEPRQSKRPKDLRGWADLVEERLSEAFERGDFDNLEAKGKPLTIDQNPYAGDRALAYSLLKNNDFAPPEIERGKEIESDIKRSETVLATLRRHRNTLGGRVAQRDVRRAYNIARDAAETRYEALLREINSKILSLNIVAPTVMHRRRLDIEAKMREFREEFPRMEE